MPPAGGMGPGLRSPGSANRVVLRRGNVKEKGAAANASINPQKASARVNPQKASARNK